MASTFRNSLLERAINRAVKALLRAGAPLGPYWLLTTQGRKTGRPHTTPVRVMPYAGSRWIVSPHGDGDWVRNARAAGRATLWRGGKREGVMLVEETNPDTLGRVLRRYVRREPTTWSKFDARPTAAEAAFAREADRHPVFRVLQDGSPAPTRPGS